MTCEQCKSVIHEDQPYFQLAMYNKQHQIIDTFTFGSAHCLAAFVILQTLASDILRDYEQEHRN